MHSLAAVNSKTQTQKIEDNLGVISSFTSILSILMLSLCSPICTDLSPLNKSGLFLDLLFASV